MGVVTTAVPVTEEEYLSNPAYEHCEYIDGRIVELNVGGKPHSKIQIRLGYLLQLYLNTHPGGYIAAELHCKLKIGARTRFRLPDVAVVFNDNSTEQRYLDRAPDLAIEIRSPDDTVTSQLRKMEDYFANGCKLAWLILPEERSVIVLAPAGPMKTVVSGGSLDGGDLMPELRIAVDELFS
jgi:Uma2 family endonuclease